MYLSKDVQDEGWLVTHLYWDTWPSVREKSDLSMIKTINNNKKNSPGLAIQRHSSLFVHDKYLPLDGSAHFTW